MHRVSIMQMQIQESSATAFRIAVPAVASYRSGAVAAERKAQQFAVFARKHRLAQHPVRRFEAETLRNHQLASGALCGCDHLIGKRNRPRHRLFTENMETVVHRPDRILRMEMPGKTDVNDIRFFIPHKLLVREIVRKRREVGFSAVSEIDFGGIVRKRLRSGIANCYQLAARLSLILRCVEMSHSAVTEQSDFQFFHLIHPILFLRKS